MLLVTTNHSALRVSDIRRRRSTNLIAPASPPAKWRSRARSSQENKIASVLLRAFELRVTSLHTRRKHFFHHPARATGRRVGVATAVDPERMSDAAVRDDAGIVALLIAIVDRAAGEDAIAVMFIRADVGRAYVCAEGRGAIGGARE